MILVLVYFTILVLNVRAGRRYLLLGLYVLLDLYPWKIKCSALLIQETSPQSLIYAKINQVSRLFQMIGPLFVLLVGVVVGSKNMYYPLK